MLVANALADEPKLQKTGVVCYHCGAPCVSASISIEDKTFCCEGCKLVYEIINQNGLCDYYKLQDHPGLSQIKPARSDKFAYLDQEEIASRLYQFTNGDLTIVTLYIPGIHCSSCMWLLEHLNRVDAGIQDSRLNFSSKEVTIHFSRSKVSLRKIAELLTTIGYEPYISLADTDVQAKNTYDKKRLFKLGVAGFCFGNIMMMSFPEYLSGKLGVEEQYTQLFRYLNLVLSLPVFFYSATEFFVTAWKGIRQRMLNIDAPIVVALIITFARSLYEILSGTGAGYLDSMTGIVFFMLVGRVVQERTYKSLSFTRDYKAYFPLAVMVRTASGTESRKLQDLKEKDVVLLHHDEIIPADSIVIEGDANIDYSFVTGESEPVKVSRGEQVYAGGRQVGEQLTIQIVKPIAGSYLTSLWNHSAFKKDKANNNDSNSAIHVLSKYFTIILFSMAAMVAAYWYFHDPSRVINSVSAMLIVACPCALLLTATFTNGNILRIFSLNGLYLRDATVIEQLSKISDIVFDKTGTLTEGSKVQVQYSGHQLSAEEKDVLYSVVRNSKHPNSQALAAWLGTRQLVPLTAWKEVPGKGLEAYTASAHILLGFRAFAGIMAGGKEDNKATVYLNMDGRITAFTLHSFFREHVEAVVPRLGSAYNLSLLSGDNDRQRPEMEALFGHTSNLLFEQKPVDKLRYIDGLQQKGARVLMMGDGLNDAGALQQSNVGVTLADDINNFTPACDAIFDAGQLSRLPALLGLARASRRIIGLAFFVSIIYNICGLYFAMQGLLKPVAAAILMPCSTISIVIITSGIGSLVAWRKGLKIHGV